MSEPESKKTREKIGNIIQAERNRGKLITSSTVFESKKQAMRLKYIVDGFLNPLYSPDGRFSRPKSRVSQYGNFILSRDKTFERFCEGPLGWIRDEYSWFISYLIHGQEIFNAPSGVPEVIRIGEMPAKMIREDIIDLLREFRLSGREGGGILFTASDIDYDVFSRPLELPPMLEKGNQATARRDPDSPGWLARFEQYDALEASSQCIELRPAWFCLVKNIFFNTPLRLPVFCSLLNTQGSVAMIEYFGDLLSNEERAYVGKALLDFPGILERSANGRAARESREMRWWIWHTVGQRDCEDGLSYREIAFNVGAPKSTIQASVERIERKVRRSLNGKLLGELLNTAEYLGVDPNVIYDNLANKNLVRRREREIDGFDDLGKLI